MIDRRDSDPGIHPDDALWDPQTAEWVTRRRVYRPGLFALFLAAVAGAVIASLVWAAATTAAPPSPAAPEPSFVAVPGGTMPCDSDVPERMIGHSQEWTGPRRSCGKPQAAAESVGSNPTAAVVPSAAPLRPSATLVPRPTATPRPAPTPSKVGPRGRTGEATWYPANGLIAAVPGWHWGDKPYRVRVTYGSRSVIVTVQDCLCGRTDRLIDLSDDAFRRLAPLSIGVIRVSVTR